MKYLAIISVGLVLLAMICYVIFRTCTPRAELTVRVIKLKGTELALEPWGNQRAPSPVWEIAITNSGNAPADLYPMLRYKDVHGKMVVTSPWPFAWTRGVLAPGSERFADVTVPTNGNLVWALGVKYHSPLSPLENTLSSWCKRVPKLRTLLPNDGDHFVYDAWHTGTNITAAH